METIIRDPYLWQQAKARTKFQGHLLVYSLINAGLWALYFFLPASHEAGQLPWPAWTSLFWGLGLGLQGLATYGGWARGQRTQREYERLLAARQG